MASVYETLGAMTSNLSLGFCVSQARYLGEKGQTVEEQRLILTRLLFCLNQPNAVLPGKQAEELFFSVTKAFQTPSQHVHALACQVIERLAPNVKSAFFATRSLVQVFEKEPMLQATALRALGMTANVNSLSDVQKLVRIACLDGRKTRLVASGAVAARLQSLPLDSSQVEKQTGPAGYPVGLACGAQNLLQTTQKCGSVYAGIAALQKLRPALLQEDRKAVSEAARFLPESQKSALPEKLPLYLAAFQALSALPYQALKPHVAAAFNAFQLSLRLCDADHEKIALLRQILKIYTTVLNAQPAAPELAALSATLKGLQQSGNHTIQTLAAIHLATSASDPQAVARLADLLPGLNGELRRSALELLEALTHRVEWRACLLPALLKTLRSGDAEIRRFGFDSICGVARDAEDPAQRAYLVAQLVENFDGSASSDPDSVTQLCAALGQLECTTLQAAKHLAASLWQRALLDGVQVRLASVQALSRIAKKYPELKGVLQQAVDVQADGFVQEAVLERAANEIERFNPEDIVEAGADLLAGRASRVAFKAAGAGSRASGDPGATKARKEQGMIKLNPEWERYEETFTNGQFQLVSAQGDDISVEVAKVFYFQEKNSTAGRVMYVFRVSAEEGLALTDIEISVGKKVYSGPEAVVFQDTEDLMAASLGRVDVSYVLDGEEDEIRIEEVGVDTFDLVTDTPVENYEEKFSAFPENLQKYTLAEMQSIDDVVDALPANTGLQLEGLSVDGKKAFFWLLGNVFGVGEAIVLVEAKALKAGGVGVKMDFRGPAGPAVQSFFE